MASHCAGPRVDSIWRWRKGVSGLPRHFRRTVKASGYRHLAGFDDGIYAFLQVAARHALWCRSIAPRIAGQVERSGLIREAASRGVPLPDRDLMTDSRQLETA